MPTLLVLLALAAGQAADRPVPAKDAAAKMTVPDGFKVTLFAGEPDIVQPIAFTFDDRGRMWVVECLSYPKWTKDGTGSDRVTILEDTDGDGQHDKKTVFLANGANLSGIEVGFGGVWLCSSPNLLFVPILDGDKPGKPEVVLDGWNMIDTKHNIFNSLGWGPDGWLYGCNGIQAKAWVGTPGTPKEKRPYMDCGVWRYHPTRKVFEPVAHGTTNPFGLDWDENGELFITNCVIDHLFHFVPGGHYQRMYGQDVNPHAYGLMKSCVDYKHWASGDWTSSRSTGTGGDPKHSDAGGGHAHSGCAIYLADNFPAEYRNTLFTANIHGNRLNNDGLARTPAGMKGVRRPDFLFANDAWFRGICVKVGPDGGLYVSDWCDTGECHNYDKADTSNGRIFRVVYKTAKQWKGDVSKLTDDDLVKMAVFDKNDVFVRKARRVLQERAATRKLGKGTADALRGLLKGEKEASRQLRALWALGALEALVIDDLTRLFDSKDEPLRAWAVRFFVEGKPATMGDDNSFEKAAPALSGSLVKNPSALVDVAIASAFQRVPYGFRRPALPIQPEYIDSREYLLLDLVDRVREGADAQLVQLTWYGLESHFGRHIALDPSFVLGRSDHGTIRRNALRYHLAWTGPMTEQVVAALGTVKEPVKRDILAVLRETLAGRKSVTPPKNWPDVYAKLSKDGKKEIVRDLEAVAVLLGDKDAIAKLTKTAIDPKAAADERRAAVELLLTRKQPEFGKTLRELLADPAVRQAALRGLAAFPDADTPAAILKAYPSFTPAEKLDAVNTLAARKEWAAALLDAIEKKGVPRADVPVASARQILALNDKAVSTRLEAVWGKIAPASKERAALTKKWKETLTDDAVAKSNVAAGRAVFTKHCAACHKMFGDGGDVGPELTGSQRANLDYVLENVLDPSAVVPREFQMINFTTTDDRVVSGIVLRETKDAVTVRTPTDTVVLPVSDVATRKQTNVSIMPDGLFEQLKPDEVRDLIAYLRAKEQVPVPK